MTFEKITYGGTECKNYLYFVFRSDYFDTDEVTAQLGVVPTSVIIKKDPFPKSTSWIYGINVGNNIDLETPLKKIVMMFEGKTEQINRIKKELGLETLLQFVIDVDINPEASTPYFGLNKRTIDFLAKTETEVDFDIYKADTIGLFNDE